MAALQEEFDKEHEHARLVLMLMEERSLKGFAESMRLEYPDMDLYRIVELWTAYCGMDGRQLPYLSIETGESIR